MGPFFRLEAVPAARRVREAATRGTLSHALLLTGSLSGVCPSSVSPAESGPDGSIPADSGGNGLWEMALYAAAAFQCQDTKERPCGVCPACRKVLRNIHPDVMAVRDEAHKFLSAGVIRAVRSDAWIRPNEGARKVYLFPDCSLLTERDQNILLKVVEEGPSYAAFVFCAENISAVLRTLRSRCVELRLSGGEPYPPVSGRETYPPLSGGTGENASAPDGDAAGIGMELCRRAAKGQGALTEFAVRLERKRLSREELAQALAWCYEACAAALFLRYGRTPPEAYREAATLLAGALSKRQTLSSMEIVRKYHGDCAWNVGPGHILGALAAEWEGIH